MSIFSRHSRLTAAVIGTACALGVTGTVIGVNAASAPSTASTASSPTAPASSGTSAHTKLAKAARRGVLGEVDAISPTSIEITEASGTKVTLALSSKTKFRSPTFALESSTAITPGDLVRVVLVKGDSFGSTGTPTGTVSVQRVRSLGFTVSATA